EKFPEADAELSTKMKSVGEVMAIGRTFAEALGKAYRALERDVDLGPVDEGGEVPGDEATGAARTALCDCLHGVAVPTERRLVLVERALQHGHPVDAVAAASAIDPWFVDEIGAVAEAAAAIRGRRLDDLT